MQQVDLYKSEAEAAYQGAPGAYSEEAAQRLLGDGRASDAVRHARADVRGGQRRPRATMPSCRSRTPISGTVPQVYELLLEPRSRRRAARRSSTSTTFWSAPQGTTRTRRSPRAVAPDGAGAVRRLLPAESRHRGGLGVRHRGRRADDRRRQETNRRRRSPRAGPPGSTAPRFSPSTFRIIHDNWTRFLLLVEPAQHAAVEHAAEGAGRVWLAPRTRRAGRRAATVAAHGLSITKIERPASHPQARHSSRGPRHPRTASHSIIASSSR